jgi:hypothetical protein
VEIVGKQRMKKFKQSIIDEDYISLRGILISAFRLSNLVPEINSAMLDIEKIRKVENMVVVVESPSSLKASEEELKGFTFEAPYNQLHNFIFYQLVYIEQIFRHTKYIVARFFKHPSGILSSYDKVMHSCVISLTLTLRLLVNMKFTRERPPHPREVINRMDITGRAILSILPYLNIVANQVHVKRLDPKANFLVALNEISKAYPDIKASDDITESLVKSFIGNNEANLASRSNELMTLTLHDYQTNSSALIDSHYNSGEASLLAESSPSNTRRLIFTGRSVASSAVRNSVSALSKLPLVQPLLFVGLDAATGELGASTVASVASSFASPVVNRISSNPVVGYFAPPALSLAANYAITGSLNTGTMLQTVLSLFVPAAKWAYGKAITSSTKNEKKESKG